MVCRVFQKSAGAKKFPSTQSRAVNPYNLEIGPSVVPQPMMQLGDPGQFPYGKSYMSNAELAELTRVFRGSSAGSPSVNLQQMQPQMNYPLPLGGGCFTISGLNLNLGGGATQQVLRPMAPAQPTLGMHQQDVANSSMMTSSSLAAETTVYGGDQMTHSNAPGNRYIGMDHCMDLDNYWPPY